MCVNFLYRRLADQLEFTDPFLQTRSIYRPISNTSFRSQRTWYPKCEGVTPPLGTYLALNERLHMCDLYFSGFQGCQ